MNKRFLLSTVFLVGISAAQTVPITQNSVTNRDIVTLAKAGFNEDFVLDFITASRTRFDVSVNALADLAKEGLSERLIRGMLAAASNPQNAVQPPMVSPTACGQVPAAAPALPTASPVAPQAMTPSSPTIMAVADVPPVRPRKMSDLATAISTQTPYYGSTSFLFGLVKRQVRIYGAQPNDRQIFPQLGGAYSQVRLVAPGGMGAHYVVIP